METIKQIVLLSLVFACVRSDGQVNFIQLNKIYEMSLNNNESLIYQITIPRNWTNNQNLYITGYSPINDPYQQPILFIKSGDYSQTCQDESSSLDQVCFIPAKQLSPGMSIIVDARCRMECDARLVAYLSEVVQVDLNEQVYIETKSSPIQKNLRIFIPSDSQFNELFLFVRVYDSQNLRQGVQMYMNIDSETQFPSKQKHVNVPLMNWGFDKAFILKKGVNVRPGDFINLLLVIPSQTSIYFQSRAIHNGIRQLQLNQPLYDYIDGTTQSRLYIIDASSINLQSLKFPITITFVQFSGSPNIEVSLSSQFKKEQLIKKSNYTWIRFHITPEMMKNPQFKKNIYIRVSSQLEATYFIYSSIKKTTFNNVIQGVTQFIEIEANQIEILTYRHNQIFSSLEELKVIELTVQNQGQAQAQIRAFQCIQQNPFKCQIKKDEDLSKISQKYKELKVQNVRQIIKIFFSSDYCKKDTNSNSSQSQQKCTTMIVVAPKQSSAGQYAVTIKAQQNVETLIQGQSRFQYVLKHEYRYFTFYLSGSNFQMRQMFVYLNVINGNVKLLASSNVVTPTLKDISNSSVITGVNNITFKNPNPGVYYITVYGVQNSDFVLTTIVRRVKNQGGMSFGIRPNQQFSQNTKITDIILKDGLSNSFTIEKGYKQLKFRFKTTRNGNVTLTVNELIGKVQTFYTRQENHKRQKCLGNTCTFLGGKGQAFFVEVLGDIKTTRVFSIVYKQITVCYRYPVGTPIFIQLDQNDTQCIQFAINTQRSLQISNSLTNLQILDKVVEIFVQFQTNQTFVMSQSSHIFTNQELSKFCQEKKECKLKIKAKSFDTPVYFQSVLQRVDGVITIYDGVIQRVDQVLTYSEGKFFRYPIQQQQSIQLFLVSQSYSQYTILAKIVQHTQNSNTKIYPQRSQRNFTNNGVWGIDSSQDSPTLTILHINKKKIKKFIQESKIKNPWLLITILNNNQKNQRVIYTLQVTQKERTLKQGQQHMGYVQPSQIVTYQIYPSVRSLLSIRSLQRNKCFKFLDQNKKRIESDIVIQSAKTVPITYYVQSLNQQSCMYQISLQNFQSSIITITQGFPTEIVVQYSQVTYLLYYHNRNASFKVYEFIEVGYSELFVTPLNNFKIQDGISDILDDVELNKFKYKTNLINNIQIQAKQNSSSYCYNCYYFIAVKGTPSVKQDIVVVTQGVPVTIKQHSIIDSYLDPGQNQTFIYYSSYVSNFNISLDVVYGRISLKVISYKQGSQGKVQRIQGVDKGTIILPIQATPGYTTRMGSPIPTNILDEKIKYKIEVQGIKQSSYHLQIIKNSEAFRISQGIASRVKIPAMGHVMLQFESLVDRDQITLNIETKLFYSNHLSASVYFYRSGFTLNDKSLIDFKQETIGKVLTLAIPSKKGHYVVVITNPLNSQYQFVALMPRPGLTQLRQLHYVSSQQQTIYQIYIQEGKYAIIEVFSCEGSIMLRGSSEIDNLLGGRPHEKQVQLLHENYGGHFVISTPINVSGQYFIRVQNKQYTAHINSQVGGISYMISYRLLNNTQINPYYVLDAPDFRLGVRKGQKRQNISFYAKNIKALNSSVKVRQILYLFIIGSSPENIQKFLFCPLEKKVKQNNLIFTTMVTGVQIQTQYNISKLQIVKKYSGKSQSFVGGIAVAMIQYENGQIYDSLLFTYQPSFLGEVKSQLLITAFGFFEIMVIISAIIGGAVVIYSLVVHLLKLRLGYFNQNELIQEQSTNKVGVKQQEFQISKTKEQKQKEDKSENQLK